MANDKKEEVALRPSTAVTGISANDAASLDVTSVNIKNAQKVGGTIAEDKAFAEQNAILANNGIVYPTGAGASGATSTTTLPKSWTSSGGSGGRSSKASSTTASMVSGARLSSEAAQEQAKKQVDYAVDQGVKELERAEADAQEQFDTQQKQIDADEAKALDNQALYAEARGDRGGIGQAQYNEIQNTAMNNRRAINSARTKLATDTQRQIADLRAQGEFQKADAVLQITQNYLAQLTEIQKWGAEFTMAENQFNAQLDQWQKEYDMKVAELTGTFNGQATMASKTAMAQAALAALETPGVELTEAQMQALLDVYGYDEGTVAGLKAQAEAAKTAEANTAALEMAVKALDLGATLTSDQYALLIGAGWTDAMIKAKQQEVARKNITKDGSGTQTVSVNYQSLYAAGYSPEDAYMYLTSKKVGYTDTEAQKIVEGYASWREKENTTRVEEIAREMKKNGYSTTEVYLAVDEAYRDGLITAETMRLICNRVGCTPGAVKGH